MMKKIFKTIFFAFLVFAFSFSLPAFAATHTSLSGNEAIATFNTFSGCEDKVVGVTVRQNEIKDGPGSEENISEISVFGNFDDICEFGTHTSFFGTTTVSANEFSQDGVNGATLHKTLNVQGFEISLDLVWIGTGETEVYGSKIKEDGPPKVRGSEDIRMRDADVSGTFSVNGVGQISGNTVINGDLNLIDNKSTIGK